VAGWAGAWIELVRINNTTDKARRQLCDCLSTLPSSVLAYIMVRDPKILYNDVA